MARKPAVSGQFYPGDPDTLRSDIESFLPEVEEKQKALGALCPHAGYAFSGPVAGKTLGTIEVPDTVLILNPSHAYRDPALALWPEGGWQTPLGTVPLHRELTDALGRLDTVTVDDRPHMGEHSAEVIVPFLQYLNPDVRIAVLCVTSAAGLEQLKDFGRACADLLEDVGAPSALVVASSDMSHERGADALETVRENDPIAIAEMEKLDTDSLYRKVRQQGITMCGVLPAMAMMSCAKARGGTEGILVERATSADSPLGRGTYVVGYAGMIFR